MLVRRRLLPSLLLLAMLSAVAACDRLQPAALDPGVNLGDPDVGGGVGQDAGPETPIPTASPTNEASPRLDAATAAAFPTATPTADRPTLVAQSPTPTTPAPEPTIEPTPEATAVPPTPTPDASPTPAGAQSEIVHVVQPGENLYRIGLQYGLSWVVIAEYNGIVDPNSIVVGQELRIPPTPTPTAEAAVPGNEPPPAAAGPSTVDDVASAVVGPATGVASSAVVAAVVTVAPGDTLYAIAQRHGISWEQVAEANGLSAANQIYAGQVLKIPADAPGPPQTFAHQVHRGETLTGIARQYGLSPADLAAANGLTAPYVIYPGQALVIPGE